MWKDAPTEVGYYWVENEQERCIVSYDEDGYVSARWGICPLPQFGTWKWYGPIQEPPN